MEVDITQALTVKDIAKILDMDIAYVRRKYIPEMERITVGRKVYVTLPCFNKWLEKHKARPQKTRSIYQYGKPFTVLGHTVYPILN